MKASTNITSWIALAIFCATCLQSPAPGVQDNPFGSPDSANSDPFGSEDKANANPFGSDEDQSDNPFGPSKREMQRINASKQKLEQTVLLEKLAGDKKSLQEHLKRSSDTINQLRAQLRNQQSAFDLVKSQNVQLKNRLDGQTHQMTLQSALQQDLLLKLMRSGNKEMMLLALSNIQSRSLSDEGAQTVVELSKDEDQSIKVLAMQWLKDSRPDISRTMGFQNSGRWQATNESDQYKNIATAMEEPCNFDFDQVCLVEIADELQDLYRFNVNIANSVDEEMPITFKVSGVPLRSGLEKMFSKHGIEFQINSDVLEIVPEGQDRQPTSRIYHVKGVVEKGLPIEKVVDLINDMLDTENVKLSVIDEVRLGVKAPEPNQWSISKLLGELAKK